MARTNVPLSALAPNDVLADPAGTGADDTDGNIVNPLADWPNAALEEIVLRVVNADTGSCEVTVSAGSDPPALEAGVGDLVETVAAGDTAFLGPFTSARFAQSDGSLHIDCDDDTSVTLTALHVPRTA